MKYPLLLVLIIPLLFLEGCEKSNPESRIEELAKISKTSDDLKWLENLISDRNADHQLRLLAIQKSQDILEIEDDLKQLITTLQSVQSGAFDNDPELSAAARTVVHNHFGG